MARRPKKETGVYSRRDKEGNTWWYCRTTFHGRDSRTGPFSTMTDAKHKREELRADHRQGRVDPDGGWQLLDELIERHRQLKTGRKDQRSQQQFSHWWRERFKAKGLKRVKDLTIRALEDARDDLKTEVIKVGQHPVVTRSIGKKPRTRSAAKQAEQIGKHREPATINRYFGWLRSLLKPAKRKREELFDHWTWEREPKGRTRHLSPEEEARLMAQLGPTYGPWARFAILTGLRQAEQFRLEWKHVDLEHGLATLPTTKAGQVQHVQLSEDAQAILRGFDSWQRSRWVFPSENPAGSMDAANFYRRTWIPAVKRAGIEWVTWHDLRHTYASRLAMTGHNETTIAALLRHSTTTLVRRYAHLNAPHLRQAVESVARFGKEPMMGAPPRQEGDRTAPATPTIHRDPEGESGNQSETVGSVGAEREAGNGESRHL